ncbi:hypothetical protein [Lichenicola sp.]|uniref:hypothetical protein n=1 Tax=Lichenicola sp. TaxID=2804529 RepID=UPI003AFFFB14
MPFDGVSQFPHRDPPAGRKNSERPLRARDWLVAALIAVVVGLITLVNCRLLLGYWHG